ncbi:hypothetical protein LIER_12809 [Lithospermum erythrorhizon]|uniref:Uncharacterized protein n=1 Tax=Lithospermum erythrorhizon TaxID=34254 RepID=A0AAV3PYC4_LITER
MSPLVLAASIQGKPLILYVVAQEQFVGALLAQENEEGHPLPAEWELCDDLPDEDVMSIEIRPPWKMYVYHMLPYSFTLNNGKAFHNKIIADLCNKFKIKKYHSTMYYP